MRAVIAGSGVHLPPFPVTNQMIGDFFPAPPGEHWTPQWVERKLGIQTRRNAFDFSRGIMRPGYYDLDNAFAAARLAIDDSGMDPRDIDRVLYATSTPEFLMPDPACMLHQRLGLRSNAPAVGMTSVGCGGFIYILDIADSEIRAGKYKNVLLVGSVSIGPYIESLLGLPEDEKKQNMLLNIPNAYIFGEGSAAFVMKASEEESGILHSYAGADGNHNPVLFEAGGSRHPATHETVSRGQHRFNMDTGLVKSVGPRHFMRAVATILRKSGMSVRDIDHFIFHQVNYELLQKICASLGVPWEKVAVHVDHYGNLDTATLGVGYHELKSAGRIKKGDLILFAAIGAGWQYGAVIVRA